MARAAGLLTCTILSGAALTQGLSLRRVPA
jgi:hypothetical protein